jgi:hypothetical protein
MSNIKTAISGGKPLGEEHFQESGKDRLWRIRFEKGQGMVPAGPR